MAQFRKALPQLSGEFFLTDGGIETTLIFLERLELPDFAAFDLLKRKEGEAVLRKYFQTYSGLASASVPGSFSKAQRGAPAQTGAQSWATAPKRWPRQIAVPLRCLKTFETSSKEPGRPSSADA